MVGLRSSLKMVCILDMHCQTMDIAMHPGTLSLDCVMATGPLHRLRLLMVLEKKVQTDETLASIKLQIDVFDTDSPSISRSLK